MKRILSVLAAAVVASGLLVAGAYAAKPEPAVKGPPPESIKKGMEGAPAAIQSAGITCTLKNAAWVGGGKKTVDKKSVPVDTYEVACGEGPGYLIQKMADSADAYPCIQLRASAGAGNKTLQCTLPENQDYNAQIQPLVDHAGLSCHVADVMFLGTSSDHFGHYEVSCGDQGGYFITVDTKGAPTGNPVSCLQQTTDPTKWPCKLTTKAQAVAGIAAMAKPYDEQCQASDARFVGRDTSSKSDYYEVACSNKAGFMLEANGGKGVRVLDCLSARSIGGGCTMTDTTKLAQAAGSGFAATLQKNGVPCTATDTSIYGKDKRTNRDIVEFKCPEQPFGVVAVIPGAGSTGKFDHYDCLGAAERALDCQLTPKKELLARLKPILVAIGKTCEPTDFAMHGPDDGDGDLVEVKCGGGQPGYILDLPPDRSKTIKTIPCAIAARGEDKCTIAGNT
ncbi:MAG TPA: hypothetical protein VG407_01430 [Caulobacteraceae bacterium]|nr:hypothetical protein [Caulobacteraceae bacterium]